MYKAIVAIAVALAFVLPGSAAIANFGTIGLTNVENPSDIENIVEISTNSDEVITSDTSEEYIPMTTTGDDIDVDIARDLYDAESEDSGWYYDESGMAEWPEWDTEMASVVDTATYIDSSNTEVLPSTGITIYVDDDADPSWYNETQVKTITEGITNVTVGGMVYVYNGTYYEKVVINKQLDLIGESRENVIVDGGGNGNVFCVTADKVNISTFAIRNGTYGIYSWGYSKCNIMNCDVYGNSGYGLYTLYLSDGTITDCTSRDNAHGIYLYRQSNCKLRGNSFYNNLYNFGIEFFSVVESRVDIDPSNTIEGRPIYYLVGQKDITLDENDNFGMLGLIECTNITVKNSDVYGILLVDTSYSTVSNITSHGVQDGIYVSIDSTHNSIVNCNSYGNYERGFRIIAEYTNIANCTAHDNKGHGINIAMASYTTITNCTIYNNGGHGFLVDFYPIYCSITNCEVYGNLDGIHFGSNCAHSTIANCYVHDNHRRGIHMKSSESYINNCTTHGHHNSKYGGGITIHSFRDTISNCVITNCVSYDNTYGVQVTTYKGNVKDMLFYNNDFGYNRKNIAVDRFANIYDNGTVGNFWADYREKYPNAIQIDGIWDTPYEYIGGSNKDNYPLVYAIDDETLPTTTHEFDGTIGDNEWHVSDVNVTLIAVDYIAGVNYTMYDLDDDGWTEYNNSFLVTEDGIHALQYYSVDWNNNVEETRSTELKIDRTNPETTYELFGTKIDKWYVTNVNIELTAMDATSGVNYTMYNLDNTIWNEYNGIFTVTENGYHTLEYYSVDNAGNNEAIKTVDFKIAKTPSDPELISPENGIAIEDQTPTFDWMDVSGYGGVNYALQVATDLNFNDMVLDVTGFPESEYTASEDLELDTYYWRVRATDSLDHIGDWSVIWNFYIAEDITPPTMPELLLPEDESTMTYPAPFFDWADSYDDFGIDYYTLQIATDEYFEEIVLNIASEISEYQLTWNERLDPDDYYWKVRAVDNSGNIGNWVETWTFTLIEDIDPPVVTVMYPNGGEIVYDEITIQWNAEDAIDPDLDGTIVIEYSANNGATWYEIASGLDNTGTCPWDTTIVDDGTQYLIQISATDDAMINGNDTSDATFIIDSTAPYTIHELSGTMGSQDWYVSDVEISLTAIDNASGVDKTWYKVNDGNWEGYTETIVVSDDGEHTIYYYSVDYAEHGESEKSVSFKIDQTKPTTTYVLVPHDPDGSNGWYVSCVTIVLFSTDEQSGVDAIWYRIDTGFWTLYTVPFRFCNDGQHTIEYYSFDKAGNKEDTNSIDVKIDKIPPVTKHEFDGVIGKEDWFVSNVTVTLSASDATSGVNYTKYMLDNGTWMNYTEPFNVTEDGDYTLYYYSVDLAGNTEKTNEADFKIEHDVLPPLTTHEFEGVPGDNDWYKSIVVITLSAVDDSSGVDYTMYNLDDTEWQKYMGLILVTEDGYHNITYYSVDKVGNKEGDKEPFDFKIDHTDPTINLTWDGEDSKLVADVDDETSGIAKVEFYVNDDLVGTVTTAPYEWEVTRPKKGDMGQAIVFDNAGNEAISEEIKSIPQDTSQSHGSSSTQVTWPFSCLQKQNIEKYRRIE